jgi:WD40 repeat protein/tRNA A-37 threonylcarbamoyl transferase component Bud32
MSGDEPEVREGQLASWLASCDDALAAGGQPPLGDDAGVTPAVQAQRQRGLALLRLLRQALLPKPGAPAAADSEVLTLGPRQAPAGEELGPPEVPGYHVLGELGRGGMGVVYKARQVKLDRLVALKVILAGDHAGAQARARFRAEAEAVARLQHPNVVQIYDVGEHHELPFFSLEFCPGGSLADRLGGTPLPPRPAAALAETLARAVHAAHQAGVVHRDLKPANVLLAADGTPKITDFGLAKRLDRAGAPTRSGAIMGTPSYMAPEQTGATMALAQPGVVHQEVGPATDVYALGAILYELLTGRPPFKGSSPMNTVLQLLTCEPVPPRLLVPKVPRDLETVCLKCLQKDARKRYASAAELADDLQRFRAGEPIRARPVGPAGRAWRWARRRPAAAGLLALAVVTLAALITLAVGAFYNRRLEAQRARADEARAEADEARVEVERQRDLVRRTAYAVHTNQAASAWRDAEIGRMLLLLDAQRPDQIGGEDLRGFEWYYLWGLCHADLRTLTGHTAAVWGVAFSPDGKRLASASTDGTVKLWDARTGRVERTLEGHPRSLPGVVFSNAHAVAFSPDGTRLAGACAWHDSQKKQPCGEVKVWDAASGEEKFSCEGHTGYVYSVAWSPDGTRLASASYDKTVKVWDAHTGQEALTLKGHRNAVNTVAWSGDGARLASASDDYTVRVWDARTGQEALPLPGYAGRVFGVAFSPDGSRLAGAAEQRTVKVWDVQTGQEVLAFKRHALPVQAVAWSPDGDRLASASQDGTAKVWDARTGEEALTLKGHTLPVTGVAWSPDGSRLASASQDGTVKVWDSQRSGEARSLRGHTQAVYGVAFSPDGSRLASAGQDQAAQVWDAHTGREAGRLEGPNGPVYGVAWNPDGTRLACACFDRTVRVWDVRNRLVVLTLKGHTSHVQGVAWNPDGSRLASASWDRTVKVWDAQTGQDVLTLPQPTTVRSVAFDPDGRQLASGSDDGTVRVWDVQTGLDVLTLKGHTGVVWGVAWSPDGSRLASGSGDTTLKVWDAHTGQLILPLTGHTLPVQGVAWSPDGKRLASASMDGTVKLWDVQTGQETLTLKEHTGPVWGVAFSPDGTQLASGGEDRTVRVWDAPAEAPRTPASGP